MPYITKMSFRRVVYDTSQWEWFPNLNIAKTLEKENNLQVHCLCHQSGGTRFFPGNILLQQAITNCSKFN